ncbi:MAG: hypothetical protein IPL73_24160 [Candidatus Obscuribacter sp.]|nr:hypothetical protein [Candidatus Obscuribacter sp.]
MNNFDRDLPEPIDDDSSYALVRFIDNLKRRKMFLMSVGLTCWVAGMFIFGKDTFNGDWSNISEAVPKIWIICCCLTFAMWHTERQVSAPPSALTMSKSPSRTD